VTETTQNGRASAVEPDELRTLFLFEGMTDEQLAEVAAVSEVRAYPAGSFVFRAGEAAAALWVLIEGRVKLMRLAGGDQVVVNETDHRGAYAGAVRAFASSRAVNYETTLEVMAPSRVLRFPADEFGAFVQKWFPMAVHLFDGLFVGIRTAEATVRQREHLAQLGALAANLAHELNNPAAAAARATAQLRGRVAGMRNKLGHLAGAGVDPDLIARLVAVQETAVERAAKAREPLSAIEESDREDEFADHLEDLGVSDALDLAPVFVAAGLDPEWVDSVAEEVGEGLETAMRWLAYTLESEALMDELEDASTRISALVTTVKEYSHLDQATHQDVDLHTGLDSTVTMLGGKLRGVRVVREYDRSLPLVPAYAAELNQVWTNLIDNAAAAMGGEGTLTLRTRRDGDIAVVEIADSGPGIPEEIRGNVFDPFFTTKAQGDGSGLGLDNARRVAVHRHGGTITFDTGPEGTTFVVGLPMARSASSAAADDGDTTFDIEDRMTS
jgi:signal transduction histidine kinase